MRFHLGLLFALTMLVSPVSASAGWKDTDWAWSEVQVRKAYPAAALKEAEGARWLELYNQQFAGFDWDRISLTIRGGQLAKVSLDSQSNTFRAVADQLGGQFGPPLDFMDKPGTLNQRATFRDTAKGNLITVRGTQGLFVMVAYQPASSGF